MKPPKRSRPAAADRDEQRTAFTLILERLLELEPSILAAVLVDMDGEAVDYAGELTPFSTKIASAYLRIALDQLGAFDCTRPTPAKGIGRPTQVLVRGVRRSFLIRPLPDGYALVAILKRQSFAISRRALAITERELAHEAGWSPPVQSGPTWYPVHVEPAASDRRRPLRMLAGSSWQRIEILGSLVGLGRDRGYRCRLRSGAELTLVREPAGTWYADELVDETATDERAS